MKVNLVLQPAQFTSFTSWYLVPLWSEYFDITLYDSNCNYDQRTLFVFWWMNASDPLVKQLQSQGHKVVVDNLWEVFNPNFGDFYQLNNTNWFWWNESLWWRALSQDQYTPNKTYKNTALMPIGTARYPRNVIVERLAPFLDQMIWSYREQRLPGDSNDQRYLNPQWYNDTCVSVVVETSQFDTGIIVTEKSYKPCAFYHPMLIVGQAGVLNYLKSQGFETFENLFDESYDCEADFSTRLALVIKNLGTVTQEPYSALTWQKLEHNHNHFFNQQLITKSIIKEIIEPLIHYAET